VAQVGQAAGYAEFERHGSGIGSRLMQGMGWSVGDGLGQQRQGMPEPLAAVRRPRRRGLGAE
jgi:G patch domain-containing protein 2